MNLYLPILVLGGIAAAFALGSVALAQITGWVWLIAFLIYSRR